MAFDATGTAVYGDQLATDAGCELGTPMLTTYADGVFPVMFAAKLLPWPGYHMVRRDNFIAQTVQLGPGAALAEVRFGYEEFGTPGQFFCTSRQEACASGDRRRRLFSYRLRRRASGGVVRVRVSRFRFRRLPGRVVWWQEFRSADGGAAWTAQGQVQPAAVP